MPHRFAMPHRFPTTRRVVTTCTIALLAAGLTACGTTQSPTTTPTTPAAQATGRAALVLDDGWVKAAEAPGAMTAMFGMLRNPTDHAVTVTGGSSAVATAVELHEPAKTDAGTMQMQPKPGGFTIPAGGTQVLQPGGDHVMLMGLSFRPRERHQHHGDPHDERRRRRGHRAGAFVRGRGGVVRADPLALVGLLDHERPPGSDRRTVLLSGLAGAGLATGLAAVTVVGARAAPATGPAAAPATGAPAGAATVAPPDRARALARPAGFRGAHQAGILEPPPTHASLVALDLLPGADGHTVRRLLAVWTDDIERLTAGRGPLTDLEPETGPGHRSPHRDGGHRPGHRRPGGGHGSGLARTVARPAHRPAGGTVERWRPAPATLRDQPHDRRPRPAPAARRRRRPGPGAVGAARFPRAPRGPRRADAQPPRAGGRHGATRRRRGRRHPAVGRDRCPAWLRGGTSVVVRRIAMDLDRWDRVDRAARENAIGRRLDTGAPVTGTAAEDAPDLEAVDELGFHRIDDAAHLRRAHAAAPHERFLRRPYSYDDPPEGGATSRAGWSSSPTRPTPCASSCPCSAAWPRPTC